MYFKTEEVLVFCSEKDTLIKTEKGNNIEVNVFGLQNNGKTIVCPCLASKTLPNNVKH